MGRGATFSTIELRLLSGWVICIRLFQMGLIRTTKIGKFSCLIQMREID